MFNPGQCVCVCECVREREREPVCVCVCACVRACVRESKSESERDCVCVDSPTLHVNTPVKSVVLQQESLLKVLISHFVMMWSQDKSNSLSTGALDGRVVLYFKKRALIVEYILELHLTLPVHVIYSIHLK